MNLVSLTDWPRERIEAVIDLALRLKRSPAEYAEALRGKTLLMIFQKPSLRTRISFEVAMAQLGGHAIFYDLAHSPWGAGKESVEDTARAASRYVDAIMARLYSRRDMAVLAEHATVPVINGLTDFEHPCQALGDLMTLKERFGRLEGLHLAYVGDAHNNVTHSLIHGCNRTGVKITIGCPRERRYRPTVEGADAIVDDVVKAVEAADAIYTDTWMSYHVPADKKQERVADLTPFRVTRQIMACGGEKAVFLHCLPAQRGMEVTEEVIDGPQSAVFDQAENRLHTEKAVLLTLLGADA